MLGKMLGLGRNEHYDRGIRLFDQSLYEPAIEEFRQVLDSEERDAVSERLALFYTAEAHASLGNRALKRGAWERAIEHYDAALEIHPQYADLHFNHALARRRRLEYQDALQSLDRALEINPRYAKARFHRGIVLYAMADRSGGLDEIEQAVALEPAFGTESLYRGLRAHALEDFPAALHAFEMVSGTEVEDIQFHYQLGDDFYKRGMFEEAIQEYEKALDLNPNYADVNNHLGLAASAAGKRDSAGKAFQNAISANPAFVEAWINLGVLHRELGRFDDSTAAFKKALELDDTNPIALTNLQEAEETRLSEKPERQAA
jgi:tetratricopeptide (TPR) repeat protein